MRRQLQIKNGVALNELFTDAPPVPTNGWTFVDVTDRPDAVVGWTYDHLADTFTPPATVEPVRSLSKGRFLLLLTPNEYLALEARAAGGDTTMIYALKMLAHLTEVETGHPLVVQMFAHVVSVGLMTQARADAIKEAFYAAAS